MNLQYANCYNVGNGWLKQQTFFLSYESWATGSVPWMPPWPHHWKSERCWWICQVNNKKLLRTCQAAEGDLGPMWGRNMIKWRRSFQTCPFLPDALPGKAGDYPIASRNRQAPASWWGREKGLENQHQRSTALGGHQTDSLDLENSPSPPCFLRGG